MFESPIEINWEFERLVQIRKVILCPKDRLEIVVVMRTYKQQRIYVCCAISQITAGMEMNGS